MDFYMEDESLISVHFDDILDYMSAEPHKINSKLHTSLQANAHGNWFGPSARTANEVTNLGLVGDKDLFSSLDDKVSELRKALGTYNNDYSATIKESRRVRSRSSQGDELDIHSIYQGRLDTAWSTTTREVFDKETKLVTLLIDNEDSANCSAQDSLWRAAAAVVVADELERAGKSVRIITYGGTRFSIEAKPKTNFTVTITIKQFNSSLSLDRLAAMTHIGFGRGPGFLAMCMQPNLVRSGLGMSVPYSDKLIPLQMRGDIERGIAKVMYLGKANNKDQAIGIVDRVTAKYAGGQT